MGNVNQEPILFNDSFFNNIAFGVENATEEDVMNAARVANAIGKTGAGSFKLPDEKSHFAGNCPQALDYS